MADENSLESPNGRSQQNEWETGHTENPTGNLTGQLPGQLEEEWRQVSAAYASQEPTPEWENPAYHHPSEPKPLPVNKAAEISRIRKIIGHCRQIALPVAIEVLGEEEFGFPSFTTKTNIPQLLKEMESVTQAAEAESEALEAEILGESEFNAVLQSSDKAHDLALTEVLAAEASHAHAESEAQSLLATALPITISIMGEGMNLGNVLPQLTQTNARLVSNLFRAGKLSRAALGLLPSIQRRAIAGLKSLSGNRQAITPELVRQVFAAQTAKVLNSPGTIGRTLTRNQALRHHTMPSCPHGRYR